MFSLQRLKLFTVQVYSYYIIVNEHNRQNKLETKAKQNNAETALV